MDAQSLLGEILSKLQDVGLKKESSTRAVLSSIFGLVNSLETKTPSLPSFLEFLQSSHDLLIHGDTAKRASMIRTIRYSLVDESYCDLLITIEIHWIIVTSLELDGTDYYNERMQALKLIDKFLSITPLKFPIAFARSLVAITNTKEDNFRKYCMETLRNLSIKNPKLVAQVSGFSPLMDAIIEPVNQQLADKNMMTILYLLNNEDTR